MQELRPTAEWTEIQVPQFVILKIQNTSISTEAKLQVYLGMEKPTNNTFGFFLTPGSSFDTLVGKNKVFVRSDSGATGGFAYSDITNKLTPTTFETEHIVADIANSFTKYIQRAHTIVVQNISDKEITLAISNDTAMRDGFVIKPYQFIGMNIAINSNIILYGEGAKASVFVTPSFDANGGINSEMMSVFEKYFGIIEIINGDYVPKAQHKNDLAALNAELVKKITDGLSLKLDIKTFNEFLQSNTESLNGVVPLNKPTQFGPGVTGSENFRDEKFRVELFTTDPTINLDAIDGILVNKISNYASNNNGDYLMTLKGMNAYLDRLNSKFVAIDGGDLQNPMASNIIAGDGLAGSMAVSGPDDIRKSGFYVCQYNLKGVETYGAILHIEDHVNVQTASQIAISGVDSSVSIRVKKVGVWGPWSTLLPSSNFDGDAFLKIIGGNVTGGTRFSGSITAENLNEVASKPYAIAVLTPTGGAKNTRIKGMHMVSNTANSTLIGMIGNALGSIGLDVELTGESSTGLNVKVSGSSGIGAKIISSSSGLVIESTPDSTGGFTGLSILNRNTNNTMIGQDIQITDGDIGISITKNGVGNSTGILNEAMTKLKDRLLVTPDDTGIVDDFRGATAIVGSEGPDPFANIILVDSRTNEILTNPTSNLIEEKLLAFMNTNADGYKYVKQLITRAETVGTDVIMRGDRGVGTRYTVENNTSRAIEIINRGASTPLYITTTSEYAFEADGKIRTSSDIIGGSLKYTPIIGYGMDEDIDLNDLGVTQQSALTPFAFNDSTGNLNVPLRGLGAGVSINTDSEVNSMQILAVNNRVFYRNGIRNKFIELWNKNEFTETKLNGLRDKTDGVFNVQIESTEDIATSKNMRCRNLISLENVTGFYSDRRLKEDITPIDGALDKVMNLNPVSYKPNDKALEAGVIDRVRLGFIAQEVKEVIPEAVERAPINDVLGTEDYLTVDNNTLIPVMLQAIKELKEEVSILREQLNARGECKCCQ